MSAGLPGLYGTDHVGFTVPDIDAATRFFVEVIGCEVVFEIGPFVADDDWMKAHLDVHPRAVIKTLRMLRCKNGPAFELFEYDLEGARQSPPANSDVGATHLGFMVEDMAAAVAHLKAHGVEVMGDPTTMTEGPSQGLTWVYFKAPWDMQLELVSYPKGMAVTQADPTALWSPKAV
ncbi:VOC family protein [Mesorhizobium xinjiangense]|uniref:VOC family protein n=1 Tax=Mesorhizobium xinjiangense TaxID=2678685 RepID=UPI0012EDDDAC|nr:VOC family protein [Mesorhizobium xinjiangense]